MNVRIREWKTEDAKSLAAALSNEKVLNNLRDGLPFPYTEKDALDYINAMRNADPSSTFAYAIDIDGTAVGSVAAFRQSNIHFRTAELGYYLAEEYWGKGVMTEAVKKLCETIFTQTDIIRIYAEPFVCNIGSRRVLEKSGFQLEGVMKHNALKNGKVLDMAMYALTKEPYSLRRLTEDEIPAALSLAWEVFSEFETPVYSEEGTAEFRRCLHDEAYLAGIEYYCAFDGETLVGEIGIRRESKHICFFFVRGAYHRRGIGTKLFRYVLKTYPNQAITLNASPYGLPFYTALGFVPTDEEQTVNGICFTPMIYPGEKRKTNERYI